jgi:hypothetical protein
MDIQGEPLFSLPQGIEEKNTTSFLKTKLTVETQPAESGLGLLV